MRNQKIKLYILTGFIGSGKTTTLMRILNRYEDRRIVVVQNHTSTNPTPPESESYLLRSCTEDGLVEVLEEFAEQDLEYLFLECSATATSAQAEQLLESNERFNNAYALKGVLCLIDANSFMSYKENETVLAQLRQCHLAVINKADLVAPELLDAIQQQVRRVQPYCDIVSCSFGGFNLEFLDHDLLSLPRHTMYKNVS